MKPYNRVGLLFSKASEMVQCTEKSSKGPIDATASNGVSPS